MTEAHEIYSRIGNDQGSTNALQGLGQIYRDQSRYREAEKAFTEAHKIHSCIGKNNDNTSALVGLGFEYLSCSVKDKRGRKGFKDAHDIYSRIGDDLGIGDTLRSLAMLYSDQSIYEEVEAFHRLAAASDNHAEDGDSTARTLLALGEDHHTQRRYRMADEAVTDSEALAIRISIGNEEDQVGVLLLLASSSLNQGTTKKRMLSFKLKLYMPNSVMMYLVLRHWTSSAMSTSRRNV